MKSNFTFLSVAASLLLTSSLFAIEDAGEQTTLLVNQSTTDVVATSTSTNFASAGSSASLGTQGLFGDTITVVNIPMSYGITDNISIHAKIPLVRNTEVRNFTNGNLETKTGMGDISIAGSYNFGSVDQGGKSDLKLRYKTSTGGDFADGLGSGTENLTFTYDYKKSLASGFDLNGNFMYTMNSLSEDASGVEFGDSYLLMLAASHESWLIPQSTTSLKFTHSDSDDANVNGTTWQNAITLTDLWLEWQNKTWIPFTPVAFGIKVPLAVDVGPQTVAEKKYLFYLTIDAPFL